MNRKIYSENHPYGIISLKPKEKIFNSLMDIGCDFYALNQDQMKPLLNQDLLENHTVPICVPLLYNPEDLYQFIAENSKILFDLALTSWPFPIRDWPFIEKNIELIKEYIEINYIPVLYQAITKPYTDTMDLNLTIVSPTQDFINYIQERMNTNQMTLNKEDLLQLNLILSTGIALVTNAIEPEKNQDAEQYISALKNSKKFLEPFKNDKLKILFPLYFNDEKDFPKLSDDKHLHKCQSKA